MCVDTTIQSISARELLSLARKTAAKAPSEVAFSPSRRLKLCVDLLRDPPKNLFLSELADRISRVEVNHRHYWVGIFYTLMIPMAVRKAQATHTAPPVRSAVAPRPQRGLQPSLS
jgi:adenine-specific DNA-methyltransferase